MGGDSTDGSSSGGGVSLLDVALWLDFNGFYSRSGAGACAGRTQAPPRAAAAVAAESPVRHAAAERTAASDSSHIEAAPEPA